MFLKKFILFAGLGLLTLALSSNLQAKAELVDDTTEEQLSKEGPLTQKDLDLYLNYYVEIETDEKARNQDSLEFTFEFAKKKKIKFVRLKYLLEKIPYAINLVLNSADDEPPYPYLKVSAAEKRLVQRNLKKIIATIQKLASQQDGR
jgi:hypothetical protein